jgi:hypothetical protein
MPKPKAQGGKKVKEENVVNDDKNWRLRIKDETEAQRHFESEWGFLLPDYDSRSEATRGPIEMKKSEYYDYQTRQWTVLEKRVTAPSAQQSSETDEVLDSNSVAGVTAATHQTLMESIPANTAFVTSNRAYGNRKTLECFGTSDHGVKAIQKNMSKSLEFRPMHPF